MVLYINATVRHIIFVRIIRFIIYKEYNDAALAR
jgi:hypothetical protein